MDDNRILVAKRLSKSFRAPARVKVLEDVSLTLHRGDTVAIMGASGEGKSTLLHILGTLEDPDAGSLSIAGRAVRPSHRTRIRNQHIGFVFQAFHLLEDYTALENVLMPANIARKDVSSNSPARRRAASLLEHMGLSSRAEFHTKLLSGGEKQRVALARALCNDPDLILADEPSGNLDHQASEEIHQMLLSFVREQTKTLVVVTHDRELASLCDRRYVLCNGRLQSID